MATPGLDSRLLIWDFEYARRFALQHRNVAQKMAELDSNRGDPAAQAALGSWYAMRGKWDWASELLSAAHKGGANVSQLTLARALRSQGHLAQAQAALARAVAAKEIPALHARLLGVALEREHAAHLSRVATPSLDGP